jgi:hypothetical protein
VTALRHKIKHALDESRTLVLGAQVLLGFEFRSFFEQSFDSLPVATRYLKAAGLACLLVAIILLFLPASYHRIVERGEDTERMHRFATNVMRWTLLPFAIGFGIDAFVAGERVFHQVTGGVMAGIGVTFVALLFWYGLEALPRAHQVGDKQMKTPDAERKLNDKIDHVLTETRMVLPGVQALLGFQMASTMMQSFESLPESSKLVHFAALLMIALSTIFLMTPPAYHRIVDRGENTPRFHRFAGYMLLAAMISLPLGLSADIFIVVRKLTDSIEWALGWALFALLVAWALWFGLTLARKQAQAHHPRSLRPARAAT